MSSAGGDSGDRGGGATSGDPRQYFCHQCNRTVSISPSPSSDLLCPTCNGGFLEELEFPIPNPNPNPPNPFFPDFPLAGAATIPLVLPGAAASPPFEDLSALFGNRPDAAAADAFNPLVFLQNYFQTLRAGGNLQLVIESGDPGGAFRFPGVTHGDYFFGPGLEELIQHLAENDPNRYGTPPASKSVVEGLPDVSVTEELLASDSSQCAVCKDTFELGETAKQIPCKHIYHADCILPWLELHNSCPVCRYELPTDDPDYEQRARRGGSGGAAAAGSGAAPQVNWNMALGSGGSADSSGSGGGDNSQRRRFRVSLPWPFRQFAETSNVGSGNNDSNNNNNSNSNSDSSGNNGGQSNSGNRGNQNFDSETRQEDLD
ncbi:hypothetical protein JHK86_045991 [Glycine max]|nr:hypothetical protein JHK86_045991 [Glycine max]